MNLDAPSETIPVMPFYRDADEVYEYVGGIFRTAAEHPEVGPKFAALGLTMQVDYFDPIASMTVRMREPMTVEVGGRDHGADLTLSMPADIADRYWRGEYNLGVGLAKNKIEVRGPVDALLALVPLTRPLFPVYREMVAAKDVASPK